MGQLGLRDDIPVSLPETFKTEALHLRSQLLLFRFLNRGRPYPVESQVNHTIEPRLNQIFAPLLSVIEDPKAGQELQDLARQVSRQMIADRGMDMEAQVLEVIRDILVSPDGRLSVKEIMSWFADRHAEEYEKRITPKWIGHVLRKELRLLTHKSDGVFVIRTEEMPKLKRLFDRYGVSQGEEPQELEDLLRGKETGTSGISGTS